MKRILVATDGSAIADRALDVASAIAARFDAELIIVTVEQGYLRGDLEEFRRSENATSDEILKAHCGDKRQRNGIDFA